MPSRTLFFVCALAAPTLLWGGAAVAGDESQRAAICAEAEARLAAFKDLPPDEALPPAAPGTVHVLMLKYTFCPSPLKIKVGTTVRFVNVEKRTSHSVWFKDAGQEESDRLFPVEFWEQTFDTPGHYPYLCGPHWEQENMRGAIEVTD